MRLGERLGQGKRRYAVEQGRSVDDAAVSTVLMNLRARNPPLPSVRGLS